MNRIIEANKVKRPRFDFRKIFRDIDNLFFQVKKIWSEINDLKFRYSKEEESFYKNLNGGMVKLNIWGGMEMEGTVKKVDKYCIFLLREGKTVLIHKSAVAYVEII